MQGCRILLYPFSVIYDGITGLRNYSFDRGWLKATAFEVPVIAVGNLSTGGTGKTPMIEYLIRKNRDKKIAVLSRGYGRKSKGYFEVTLDSKVIEVGDEPLQFKIKFKDTVTVAVCEKRADGIQKLINDHSPELILLDDAYQHRYVKASHYVLLTSYDQPYFSDYILPAGNLRESRSGAKRAQSIIVTKCPSTLSQQEMESIRLKVKPVRNQRLYFSTISYSNKASGKNGNLLLAALKDKRVTVITGIAKPKYFIDFLKPLMTVHHLEFSDHHTYTEIDLKQIHGGDIILTTEKDYVKLKDFEISNLYYIPIEVKFIGKEFEI